MGLWHVKNFYMTTQYIQMWRYDGIKDIRDFEVLEELATLCASVSANILYSKYW